MLWLLHSSLLSLGLACCTALRGRVLQAGFVCVPFSGFNSSNTLRQLMNEWVDKEYKIWENSVLSTAPDLFYPTFVGPGWGQGGVFVTHQVMWHESSMGFEFHGFWIPHCFILLSFSLLLFACTEENQSSLMVMMFPFLHPPESPQPLSKALGQHPEVWAIWGHTTHPTHIFCL